MMMMFVSSSIYKQVTDSYSIFGLIKCLSFKMTQSLTSLDLSHVTLTKVSPSDEAQLIEALANGACPSLTRLSLVDTGKAVLIIRLTYIHTPYPHTPPPPPTWPGLGDRAIRSLSSALSAGACKQLRELEIGDNRYGNPSFFLPPTVHSLLFPQIFSLTIIIIDHQFPSWFDGIGQSFGEWSMS